MPLDILQEYGIAPVVAPQTPLRIATTGDKRSAPEYDSDDDDGSMYSPVSPDTPSLTFSSGGSDSDSSQVSALIAAMVSSCLITLLGLAPHTLETSQAFQVLLPWPTGQAYEGHPLLIRPKARCILYPPSRDNPFLPPLSISTSAYHFSKLI